MTLNGTWKLYLSPNRDCRNVADPVTTEAELTRLGYLSVDATVPGNFELDLERAGLFPDPFYGMNPLLLQKWEDRHLWYVRSFLYDGEVTGRECLHFGGIDTVADVYLNGRLLGHSENMLISHTFPATGLHTGENELLVHISPAFLLAREQEMDLDTPHYLPYNAETLVIRKAPHTYGWDIAPRAVSGGLWRSVELTNPAPDRIDSFYLYTFSLGENRATLALSFATTLSEDDTSSYTLHFTAACREHTFSRDIRLWHNKGYDKFEIQAPLLWWPRHMGDQNLYEVRAELRYRGTAVATYETRLGIRTVVLDRTDTTDPDYGGEFRFLVNGEPFFVMGTNWVPLDAFHSRDAERLSSALQLLYEVGCNAVRLWGGNVYEDHPFFDFCDEHGILVWQDFSMACGSYPQNKAFCEKLRVEVEQVVRKLRGHASLGLWSGDNECDQMNRWYMDPNQNVLTRKVIPEVLRRLDPARPYLPSSPYMSEAYCKGREANDPNCCLPEDHLWGPRDYFKSDFYLHSVAHFASEIGYHGCPSPASVKRFLSPEAVWPPEHNPEWLLHAACMVPDESDPFAYRIELMRSQTVNLFGERPDDLDRFAALSQFCQAEAFKFFVESFRTAKWKRTGIIWWNLIDCWPQFSDAVVDYYGCKKIAYSMLRRSQEPVCLMMREPENGKLTLVAANEFRRRISVIYTLRDLDTDAVLLSGEAMLEPNGLTVLEELPHDGHFGMLLTEWQYEGKTAANHYLTGKAPYSFDAYRALLRKAGFDTLEDF